MLVHRHHLLTVEEGENRQQQSVHVHQHKRGLEDGTEILPMADQVRKKRHQYHREQIGDDYRRIQQAVGGGVNTGLHHPDPFRQQPFQQHGVRTVVDIGQQREQRERETLHQHLTEKGEIPFQPAETPMPTHDGHCNQRCHQIREHLDVDEPADLERTLGHMTPNQHAAAKYHDQAVHNRQQAVRLEHQHSGDIGAQVENQQRQKLVDSQGNQQAEIGNAAAGQQSRTQHRQRIYATQQQPQGQYPRKIVLKGIPVLRNAAVVEGGGAHVQQHVKDEGQVEQREVESIGLRPHQVLHRHLNAENPEGLDQQIQAYQQQQVTEKTFTRIFHSSRTKGKRDFCDNRIGGF